MIEQHPGGGFSITGAKSIGIYRAIVLKQAISLYAKSGMVATRGLTPTKMLALATGITGKPYKRGQYDVAIADLYYWCEAQKESKDDPV